MLIKNWRDAGQMFEADAGGSGAAVVNNQTEPVVEPVVETVVVRTADQLLAELAATKTALKIANKEAGDRRKKLDELDAAAKLKADAELSEVDKATKRATDAEQRLLDTQAKHKTTTIKAAIKLAAVTAGFVDVADAVALADYTGIDVDQEGNVSGAVEAVKKLSTAKPHLLKSDKVAAPNINSASGGMPQPLTVEGLVQQRRRTDNIYVPF